MQGIMRIESLHIRNVGPFKEATVDFATIDNAESGEQPITIVTGMNGAGKSIVIDSIRAILSGQQLERNIVANDKDFCVEIDAEYDGTGVKHLSVSELNNGHFKWVDYTNLHKFFQNGYNMPDRYMVPDYCDCTLLQYILLRHPRCNW